MNNSITAAMKAPYVLALCGLITLCACRISPPSQPQTDRDREGVILAVVTDMVIHAADDVTIPRCVELSPGQLQQLKERCGPRFRILSADEAEFGPNSFHLKRTREEAILVRASIISLDGGAADVGASYDELGSGSGFRYRLQRIGDRWRVIKVEFVSAS
jgi:hypothetical protein